jgi:hypothetical protein
MKNDHGGDNKVLYVHYENEGARLKYAIAAKPCTRADLVTRLSIGSLGARGWRRK